MFLGSLIVIFSVIFSDCIDAESNNNDDTITVEEKSGRPPSYSDLNNENSFMDSSNQKYYQESTPLPVKMQRDDDFAFARHPFNQIVSSTPPYSPQFYQSISNTNFPSNMNNKFYVNGIDNLDHRDAPPHHFVSPFSSEVNSNDYQHSNEVPAYPSYGGTPPTFTPHGGNNWGGYGGGSSPNGGGHSYHNNLEPIIHKSIYVHIAPPEEEVPKQRVILPHIPPKKNYQIVFIRAPTPPTPAVPVIPPFPPQSDKTLIYVLHPKPEELPPIHIPAPPQNDAGKPEVYFIRYKSQKKHYDDTNNEESSVDDNDGGIYGRRYGRDGLEDGENESLNVANTDSNSKSVPSESQIPSEPPYDEQADISGESSNIVRVNATESTTKSSNKIRKRNKKTSASNPH